MLNVNNDEYLSRCIGACQLSFKEIVNQPSNSRVHGSLQLIGEYSYLPLLTAVITTVSVLLLSVNTNERVFRLACKCDGTRGRQIEILK